MRREPAPGRSPGDDIRVLVIEDEPKLADYLRKGLSEIGYVVDLATDGIASLLDTRHP